MIFSVFQKNWVFGYSWSTLLWYPCYYPHRSRDALSPVCGIFSSWWLSPRIAIPTLMSSPRLDAAGKCRKCLCCLTLRQGQGGRTTDRRENRQEYYIRISFDQFHQIMVGVRTGTLLLLGVRIHKSADTAGLHTLRKWQGKSHIFNSLAQGGIIFFWVWWGE